jgi:acyl carrier protein
MTTRRTDERGTPPRDAVTDQIVAEVLALTGDHSITSALTFNEIGLDSAEMVSLIYELDEKFEVELESDDHLVQIMTTTIEALAEHVCTLLSNGPSVG